MKKKRNEFLISMFKNNILISGRNDFYAVHANNLLFFMNEEASARQVRQQNLYNPLFNI